MHEKIDIFTVTYPVRPKKVSEIVGRINNAFALKKKFLSVGQLRDLWNNVSLVVGFG
jgi:hypothetical protein